MSDGGDHRDGGERQQGTPGVAWELTREERRQVLALAPRERYSLFLQLAVDWEAAWGLRSPDGWVLSSGEDGRDIFPLWPHPGFAEACAHGSWEGTEPAEIPLDELLDDLIPILKEDGIRIAVFLSPDGEGILIDPDELRQDLDAEMELGESPGFNE